MVSREIEKEILNPFVKFKSLSKEDLNKEKHSTFNITFC